MIDFPSDLLRGAQRVGKLDELLEWRLDRKDVAALLGVPVSTVHNWRVRGKAATDKNGQRVMYRLPYREFGRGRRRVYVVGFRLQDVEMFADLFGLPIDYDVLPDHFQREHKVGRYSTQQLFTPTQAPVAIRDYGKEAP